jgi:hypothetical protein
MANEEEKAFLTPQKKEPINQNSEIEVDRSSGSMHESSSNGGGGLHIISSEAKIIQKVEIVEKVIVREEP